MKKENWKKIEDCKVLHVWINRETKKEVEISPDFYQDNGEPIDDQGDVMEYSHTLILTD